MRRPEKANHAHTDCLTSNCALAEERVRRTEGTTACPFFIDKDDATLFSMAEC